MTNHRKHPIRTLAATLAATALIGGTAFGQQAQEDGAAAGSADPANAATAQAEADAGATATFYSDLPGNQGEPLGETTLGAATAPTDGAQDANYVVVDHEGESLAFPIESVDQDGVRVGVDTSADGEGLDGDATLAEIDETLRPGPEGEGEIVATGRQEGDAHVVTQIAPRDELSEDSPVEVEENDQVLAFDDGQVETFDVQNADAATYGELDVSADDGTAGNVLDDAVWQDEGDAPAAGDGMNGGAQDGAQDGAQQDGAMDGATEDGATTAPAGAEQPDDATQDDGATTVPDATEDDAQSNDGATTAPDATESAPNAAEEDGAAMDDAAQPAAPDAEEDAANDGGENATEEDAED